MMLPNVYQGAHPWGIVEHQGFVYWCAESGQAVPARITLMGTEPNRPRCAWCAHPLDVHGAYGCDTDDCRCGRTG